MSGPGAPFAVDEYGVYASGPRTLRDFVEATWAFGDRPFLVAENGETTSYRAFFDAACGLARRLVGEYGLRPGDRVVVAMRNHPEWQTAFWAAQLAGLVAVPLNAWWTEEELAYALDDCAPRVLLVDGERVPRVAAWACAHAVPGIVFHGEGGERVEGFEAYVPDTDPLLGPPPVDVLPEHDATIIYTSGTTGRPKGAVATHLAQAGAAMNPGYFAAASALRRGARPGAGPVPVSLSTYPFFHVAAFTSFYSVMAAGGTLILMRKWDPVKALELIRTHRVTHYAGVPTTALQLLDLAERTGDPLESVTMFNTGGAAAPPGLAARIAAAYGERIEPRNGYGLTETCGGVLANFGAEYRAHPGSVGWPTPATEVRVERPDADGVGELWLRGQALVRGYWRDEAATREAFTADGWFRTGDLARIGDGGLVTIVDRLKDMVIRGGENVYCVEVEGVLQDHPDVVEAAVLGVPHPVLGEEVAALVRLRTLPLAGGTVGAEAGASVGAAAGTIVGATAGATVGAAELRAYVGTRLAAFKVPAHLVVRDTALPRNAAGKVLKHELRDVVAGQLRDVVAGQPGDVVGGELGDVAGVSSGTA
ncbi:class I adenylate-forming enzyme family protein [Streptomyces sp. NPDC101160]|uniref:class I adenylate-forming enzyme family protein n=1 Tax=Streptomyces sp. NPDC101160 TaxID=3366118 RepID=UPI0037F44AD4